MKFVNLDQAKKWIAGKSVILIGSAPSVLDCEPDYIDSKNVIIRVNNFKLGERQGYRADIHYSFYGTSIRVRRETLQNSGVMLCMCKLPNSKPLQSAWHESNGKICGIDYRYIYENRKEWWWCDTFIPDDQFFLDKFNLLNQHQPTTGFAAILDVLACEPSELELVGYDFFTSGIHNYNEKWTHRNADDPICHRPDLELKWLKENVDKYPITLDKKLKEIIFNCKG